jgi:hypothetical protein
METEFQKNGLVSRIHLACPGDAFALPAARRKSGNELSATGRWRA